MDRRESAHTGQRYRAFFMAGAASIAIGAAAYALTRSWSGWNNMYELIRQGDNLPIAGLLPLVAFFTYLALSEARRHDRSIREGRREDILDDMYR